MDTIRDLIERSYRQAKVIGIGTSMTSDELSIGLNVLNMILDELFAENIPVKVISQLVQLSRGSEFTIGTSSSAVTPDIILDTIPKYFDNVVFIDGDSRIISKEINYNDYINRDYDDTSTTKPTCFYYEKAGYNSENATIKFVGNASGAIELNYTPSLQDMTVNDSAYIIPRSLKPYVVYELAYRLAEENEIDVGTIKAQVFAAWKRFKAACNLPATNDMDRSLGGSCVGNNGLNNFNLLNRG